MNYQSVIKYLGLFSIATCVMYVPSVLCAFWYQEMEVITAFFQSALVVLFFSGLMVVIGRRANGKLFNRESLALVGLGWLLIAGYGALPYVFAGELSFVDAYFESMSGFTTTGATVITDIEVWPKSLLFWRSFTHWLGGLGIILLLIIVLPFLGAGGKMLYRSEVPGLDKQGLRPRIKDSSLILFNIYAALTVLMTIMLLCAGMNLHEAFCHTFGALATGGFSTRNASIGAYDSIAIEIIITVFMAIAGTNFGLLYCLSRREWYKVFSNSEWRIYILILTVSSLLITANLMGVQGSIVGVETHTEIMQSPGFPSALRMATFQVVSVMTTTGYITEDFDMWPFFSRALLVMLMFVGGCSSSTGGGIKVIRVLILFKLARYHLRHTFYPKRIDVLRVDNTIIDEGLQRSVLTFFLIYVGIVGFGVIFLSAIGCPTETSFTAVAATLNNIGPGLELVGAVEPYNLIPDPGKILLSLFMAMGRLELYAICVLLIPSFWFRT